MSQRVHYHSPTAGLGGEEEDRSAPSNGGGDNMGRRVKGTEKVSNKDGSTRKELCILPCASCLERAKPTVQLGAAGAAFSFGRAVTFGAPLIPLYTRPLSWNLAAAQSILAGHEWITNRVFQYKMTLGHISVLKINILRTMPHLQNEHW